MARTANSSNRISFYFVLYLVAIISVFVITMERDNLLKKRDEDIAHLIEIYIKPLRLAPAVDTARFFVTPGQKVTVEPIRLLTKAEGPIDKDDIRYSLVDVQRVAGQEKEEPPPDKGTFTNDHGDGVLSFPPLAEGIYEFKVAGYKPRIIPDGKTMRVEIQDTSYQIQYSSRLEKIDRDTTVLIASVMKTGLEPAQLALSTDRQRDTWVLGPPYSKRIFVGGVESPERVTFDAGPFHVQRNPAERSFVTLVWDQPTLGTKTFTVRGSANRGIGEKDHASTSFTVEVLPPTFSSNPSSKAYWGIPYVFDGQIVGVNPIDLSVEFAHDGTTAWTRPVVPRDTVVPDRSWHSLAFRVLYHGSVVKEHGATVLPPPPPQIRWVKQELDKAQNVLIVTVACADPAGGPVRMSLESEPGGIARLDKIRGTNFTVTVNLESKPAGVFLKLSAEDQYGGRGNSSRQFSLQ